MCTYERKIRLMAHRNKLAEIGQMAYLKYCIYITMARHDVKVSDYNKHTRTANNYYQVYERNALNS